MASIQLKDLVPGKNYKVKVRAKYKGEDPGPWSKILNFKAPIKSKDDDDDTLNSKYGIVVGSKKDPKRGYIISSTFNGKITLKNGLVIDDDKNNTNIGTQGWAIDHKGNSIFNNIVARGQLIIDLNNNQGRMYFGENIPAFGTDKADGIKLDTYNYWFRTKSIADKRPSWRVGDENSFVSYNPDSNSADGKLIVSGQIQAGIGSANQVLLGANVGGAGIAGIKIDASNFWYDADKVANNAIVFKVSGADTTGITVNKAGRVTINTDHSGGRMTGPLTIRLTQGQAADKFLIGQDVRGSGQDGIVLNSNNYWTLQDGAGASKAAYFKVGGSSKYILWDGNDLTVSAQIQAGVGTNNTVLIGPDVGGSGIGGIKIDANNFWYDPDKVSSGLVFKIGGAGTTAITVSKNGNVLINGEQVGGSVTGTLDVTTGKVSIPYAAGKNILIGKNVSGSNDGLYLDANNYWYINNQGSQSTFNLKAGSSTSYLQFTGTQLEVRGASVRTSNATNGYIEFNSTQIIGVDGSGATNFKIDTTGNAVFKGQINNGTTLGNPQTPGGAINLQVGTNPDIPADNTFMGFNIGKALYITGDRNAGAIHFYKEFGSSSISIGSLIDSTTSKYTDTRLGAGILLGSGVGYPFIEVGYETYNSTTGAKTSPIIRLITSEVTTTAGASIELGANRFVLTGQGNSRIKGIGTVDAVPANKRVLYGNDAGSDNDNLVWGPVPTGGGTASISLETSLAQNLLGYNSSTGVMTLDTQAPNTIFAGPSSGSTSADPSFRALVNADIPSTFVRSVSNSVTGLTFSISNQILSVSGSVGSTNGTYINPSNTTGTNKITYSGSAPSTGRTNGDIHFVL